MAMKAQLPVYSSLHVMRTSLRGDLCRTAPIAVRSFQTSSICFAENDGAPGHSSPPSGRTAKSQAAYRELNNLQSQRKGLAGGAFRHVPSSDSDKQSEQSARPLIRKMDSSGGAPPRQLLRRTLSPTPRGPGTKPSGMVMARRRQPNSEAGASSAGPKRPKRRGARPSGVGSRPGIEDDYGNEDEGESQDVADVYDPADMYSDTMVKYLREEHETHKSNQPYEPVEPQKVELLELTQDSLPALPGTQPETMVARHLSGTIPEHWGPEPFQTMFNPDRVRAKRIVQGLPVKFFNGDPSKKKLIDIVNGDHMNMPRIRKAQDKTDAEQGLGSSKKLDWAPFPKEFQKQTEDRVVSGKYEIDQGAAKSKEDQVRLDALRAVQKNASYRLGNEDQFMNVLEGIMAGKPQGKAPKMGLT